jgi:hypothetical protein
MYKWHKNIASWEINKCLYLSIPFTWLIPHGIKMARLYNGKVYAGGPAVKLMPEEISKYAEINENPPIEPLLLHNPFATFTTRGCPNKCKFCAVSKIEGDLIELKSWRPSPIICDNNLLASSIKHFNKVIDSLKKMPYVDFNQGLEAKRFNNHHASRISELKRVRIRFAFDNIKTETSVHDAILLAKRNGIKDINIYVLIGFNDNPEEAKYKLEKVKSWGANPNPMRYQPLNSLKYNEYVSESWTDEKLKDYMRYYSRSFWLKHIKLEEYDIHRKNKTPRTKGFFDKNTRE